MLYANLHITISLYHSRDHASRVRSDQALMRLNIHHCLPWDVCLLPQVWKYLLRPSAADRGRCEQQEGAREDSEPRGEAVFGGVGSVNMDGSWHAGVTDGTSLTANTGITGLAHTYIGIVLQLIPGDCYGQALRVKQLV